MRHAVSVLLFAGIASVTARAAQPVPDPRLDAYYNTIAIATIQRSVQLDRAVPPVVKRKPAVTEPGMREVQSGVYVERALLPRGRRGEDESGVIRVFPPER